MALKKYTVAISFLVVAGCILFHEHLLPVFKGCKVSQAFSNKPILDCSDCNFSLAGSQDIALLAPSSPSLPPPLTTATPPPAAATTTTPATTTPAATTPAATTGGKIAVCILGEISGNFTDVFTKHKTQLFDKLQAAFFLSTYKRTWRANKIWCDAHPGDPYLLYTHGCNDIQKSGGDDWINLIQQIEQVVPLQGWDVHTRYSSHRSCPSGSVDELDHFGQHERMRDCADLIRRDESITGTRYSWVMKVRPDYWTDGWPELSELIPKLQITKAYIHGFRALGCPHDQFVLFHRSHLEGLSAALAHGYNECQPEGAFGGLGGTISECNFGALLNRHFSEGPSVLPWSGIEGCYGLNKGANECPPGRSCSFP